MNPGPICSGAIKSCHLEDLIYDVDMFLSMSEPQFPPLEVKVIITTLDGGYKEERKCRLLSLAPEAQQTLFLPLEAG